MGVVLPSGHLPYCPIAKEQGFSLIACVSSTTAGVFYAPSLLKLQTQSHSFPCQSFSSTCYSLSSKPG